MPEPIFNREFTYRLAGFELNGLTYANVLPVEQFQGSLVLKRSTPIFDTNGELLFYRYPVVKGRQQAAYADIASSPAFSQPLLAVSMGMEWDEASLLDQAIDAACQQHPRLAFDRVRFVAYSYPKVAVQFLAERREVLMLELLTWKQIPRRRESLKERPAGNFERWSLLDTISGEQKEENTSLLRQRAVEWTNALSQQDPESTYKFSRIDPEAFRNVFIPLPIQTITRQLHYSQNQSDHACYELRGQHTSEWCVAASVEMLLDFYRYDYSQERIAADLGLGTVNNPNGLRYGQESKVVTELQNLTSNALTAHLNTSPNWFEFFNEINCNRPLISFIPGHSRSIAGFTETRIFAWYTFRGLLVYDPWPPNMGVITQWENFQTQTYRDTFTAQVTMV